MKCACGCPLEVTATRPDARYATDACRARASRQRSMNGRESAVRADPGGLQLGDVVVIKGRVGVVIEPQRDRMFRVLWEPLLDQRESIERADASLGQVHIVLRRDSQALAA